LAAPEVTDVIRGRDGVLADPRRELEILGHLILHGMDSAGGAGGAASGHHTSVARLSEPCLDRAGLRSGCCTGCCAYMAT
jgi:hypothetical protein